MPALRLFQSCPGRGETLQGFWRASAERERTPQTPQYHIIPSAPRCRFQDLIPAPKANPIPSICHLHIAALPRNPSSFPAQFRRASSLDQFQNYRVHFYSVSSVLARARTGNRSAVSSAIPCFGIGRGSALDGQFAGSVSRFRCAAGTSTWTAVLAGR